MAVEVAVIVLGADQRCGGGRIVVPPQLYLGLEGGFLACLEVGDGLGMLGEEMPVLGEIELAVLDADLRAALDEARQAGASLPREKVLYLIWREPWMTVARSTYISATLATVGWDSWPPLDEPRYPAFEWDAPWLAEVDRVLLSSEPYRFRERHLAEVEAAAGLPACLVDGEMASWYGSRAAAGLRYLAALRRKLAGLE